MPPTASAGLNRALRCSKLHEASLSGCGAEPPVIEKVDPDAAPILSVLLSGDMPIRDLTTFADEELKERLQRVPGVGSVELAGGKVAVIDDYAHHPVEIRAVLSAAREAVAAGGRVIAVAQPHRYSRLKDLMNDFQSCFDDADIAYVAPVYAAGEEPIEGVDHAALVAGMKARGHRAAREIAGAEALAETLSREVQPGDLVVCLGAGDITKWAAGLAPAIAASREAQAA